MCTQWRRSHENSDLRFLVGGLDVQDTVGVQLKDDLNLRYATGSRRDTVEFELAEEVVVLGQGTLTLIYLDEDGGLVVGGCGEAVREVSAPARDDE